MLDPLAEVSASHRLLLAVLRNDATGVARHGRDGSSWSRLLPLATAHRVPTLVAARLVASAGACAAAPEEVVERCRRLLRDAALFNLAVLVRANAYAEALARAGIPVVVLKGASLAHTAYPSPEQRVFRDLDLLVPRENLDEARAALLDAGLRLIMEPDQARHSSRRHFHHVLRAPGGQIVELHWDLARPDDPYRLPGEGVVARSLRSGERAYRTEALEDQLLHAAVQSLSEGFSGLLRVCDVDAVLRRAGDALDWEGILARGDEGRLSPCLDLLLRMAERLVGTTRPTGALRLRPPRGVSLALDPLRPETMVLTQFTTRHKHYRDLFRFWLLPGARGVVLCHALLGHPRDRTRPPRDGDRRPTAARRASLLALRATRLLRLLGTQLVALLRKKEHLSPS